MENCIGIFDSGIGGLTVAKEIMTVLPNENMIYLGDTARVPYGSKSVNTVKKYSIENSLFLLSKGIKILVVACNTASALAIEFLRESLKVPIVEVIGPGARKASETTFNGKIGVIGTEATIKSGAYEKALKSINPKLHIISKACPIFVPLVEESSNNDIEEEELCIIKNNAINRYLKYIRESGIDTILLGCTHYPLMKELIEKYFGNRVNVICPAAETALEVRQIMIQTGLTNGHTNRGGQEYYVTDAPERFIKMGKRFLGTELMNVKKVNNLF